MFLVSLPFDTRSLCHNFAKLSCVHIILGSTKLMYLLPQMLALFKRFCKRLFNVLDLLFDVILLGWFISVGGYAGLILGCFGTSIGLLLSSCVP